MLMDFYQITGLIGAVISILIYAALQFNLVKAESITFSFYNLFGSVLIAISLVKYFNIGTFIVEVFWISISLYGLLKAIKIYLNKNKVEFIQYEMSDFS